MAKQGFLWYRSNLLLLLGFTCLSYNSNMQQLNSFVKDPSSNGISSSSPIGSLPVLTYCFFLQQTNNKTTKKWTKLNNQDLPTKFFFKMCDLESQLFWMNLNFTAPQFVRVKMYGKNHKNEWDFLKKWVANLQNVWQCMCEWVTNPLVRPKINSNE